MKINNESGKIPNTAPLSIGEGLNKTLNNMAESKSILEWLQEIPNETVRKQAIENYNNADEEWKNKEHSKTALCLKDAIKYAFHWGKTHEGEVYWLNIYNGNIPLEPNSLQQEKDKAVELLKMAKVNLVPNSLLLTEVESFLSKIK